MVQEKGGLQSTLTRWNSSCAQFSFWVGLLFWFVGGGFFLVVCFYARDDLCPKYSGKLYDEQNLQKHLHLIFPKSLRLTDPLKVHDSY